MSDLLSVAEALARVLGGVRPVGAETLPLAAAQNRVLAEPLAARRTQPDFDASAMDGYALRAADAAAGTSLRVVGESAAGHAFAGTLGPGEAARIFTGAPVPAGADTVLMQEDATRQGDSLTVAAPLRAGAHIRRRGLDFDEGDQLLAAGTVLGPRALMLAAAANHAALPVRRRPRVAILATGDEIVLPGGTVGPAQTVASNSFALAALVASQGGEPLDLGIAADSLGALDAALGRAQAEAADVLVTIGGASVGDHDLVQEALRRRGLEPGFWRIAMRPGKPLMHGRLDGMPVLGLPGNPVSAYVCSALFLLPLIRALLGRPDVSLPLTPARLGVALPANDQRQDFLRSRRVLGPDGVPVAAPLGLQDSSMTRILQAADCLIVRPPHAPTAVQGESCDILDLAAAGL